MDQSIIVQSVLVPFLVAITGLLTLWLQRKMNISVRNVNSSLEMLNTQHKKRHTKAKQLMRQIHQTVTQGSQSGADKLSNSPIQQSVDENQ